MTYFIKTNKDQIVKFPYTFDDLIAENENTQFDSRYNLAEWYAQTKEAEVTENQVSVVHNEEYPNEVDTIRFTTELSETPVLDQGVWKYKWISVPKTQEDIEKSLSPPASSVGGG